MSEQNRFEDVNDFLPSWSPSLKREGETKTKLEATPESWIIGHYISSRTQVIKGDEYTIHKMKVLECGNHEHLDKELPEGGGLYEFFGTHVVNATLADPSKVEPGDSVRILWEGMQKAQKEGSRDYQGWKIARDTVTTALNVVKGVIVADGDSSSADIPEDAPAGETADAPPVAKTEGEENKAAVAETAEEDDDLPF